MTAVFSEDVDVGDSLPPLAVVLTGEEIRRYADAAKIPYPRFQSDAAAKAEGLPGQIAPGNMSLALFSRLLTGWADGLRLHRLTATFRQLVRPDVPCVVRAVVTEKKDADSEPLIGCDLVLETADGDRLVTGTAWFRLPSRAAASPDRAR